VAEEIISCDSKNFQLFSSGLEVEELRAAQGATGYFVVNLMT
jgi:hypothetical protein